MTNKILKNDAINDKYYDIINQFLMIDDADKSRYEIEIECVGFEKDYHVKLNGLDGYGCFKELYLFIFDADGLLSYRDLTPHYIGLSNLQTIAKLDKLLIDNHLSSVFHQIIDSFDELLKTKNLTV